MPAFFVPAGDRIDRDSVQAIPQIMFGFPTQRTLLPLRPSTSLQSDDA